MKTSRKILVPARKLAVLAFLIVASFAANAQLTVTITGNDTLCPGTATNWVANVTGGSGHYSYYWYPSAGINCNGCSNINLSPTSSNTYSVVVYDSLSSGDSATAIKSLIVPAVSVSLATPTGGYCQGDRATFTATRNFNSSPTTYQWKRNGVNVGTDSAIYTDTIFRNLDTVWAVATGFSVCGQPDTLISNRIIVHIKNTLLPTATVYNLTATYPTCLGHRDSLMAVVYNEGTAPLYQWIRNGVNVGTNSPYYVYDAQHSTDTLWVQLTSSLTCAAPATVVSNSIQHLVLPDSGVVVLSSNSCTVNSALTLTGSSFADKIEWQLNGNPIDTINNTNIGVVLAGGNGAGNAANQFGDAWAFYRTPDGTIYVGDQGNSRIQKFTPGATNGITIATTSVFDDIDYIYFDRNGNMYVAIFGNNARISKWAVGSSSPVTVAGGNSVGSAANQLWNPVCIYVDASNNVYVADGTNNRIQKWAPGATTGVTVAGGNGPGSAANQLYNPVEFFFDHTGNLIVRDAENHRIQQWAPGATSGTTLLSNIFQSVAFDYLDNIYVKDANTTAIWKYTKSSGYQSRVIAATPDGRGLGANQLNNATQMQVDSSGNIYTYDRGAYRVQKWPAPYVNMDTTRNTNATGSYSAVVSYLGCDVATNTISLPCTLDTVWPGDANNDLVANNLDILSLGLAYQDTGSIRVVANNSWVAQYCTSWNNSFSTGVNHDHADCNGNGIVDANDTVPILLNYGFTHPKTSASPQIPGAPLLYFNIPPSDSLTVNTLYSIPVDLGIAPITANNVYGLAFTINYDSSVVKLGTDYFAAATSWLGNLNSDMISIQRPTIPGQIDCAITRTNHSSRSGVGTIGTFGFITIDNLSGKDHLVDTMHLSFSNIQMIDQNGNVLPVNTDPTFVTVTQDVDGIASVKPSFQLNLFPNPASNILNYSVTALTDKATYSLTDITGQEIIKGEMLGKSLNTGSIDLGSLPKGIYVFKLHSAEGIVTKRVVLQ